MARIQLLQRGVVKVRAESGRGQPRQRLPITLPILRQLRQAFAMVRERADGTMLWAASALCFFGFFRSGEITIPGLTTFDGNCHLSWGDVAADDLSNPSVLRVHLKRSKCDQVGQGVDVFVGKTGCDLCPVGAVMQYVAQRGPDPGCFFRLHDGSPLTKARFVARVKSALRDSGIPADNYSGHSFRIGAATAAAQAGISDTTIQMLGRWSSTAFRVYVRTPRDHLAAFSRVMSSSQR